MTSDSVNTLCSLFELHFGKPCTRVEPLPRAGSGRIYYRIYGNGHSAIGMFNPDVDENRTFASIATVLASHGISVPEILAASADEKHQLITDLGNTSLFDLLQNVSDAGQLLPLYRQSIDLIIDIQSKVSPGFDYGLCHPVKAFTPKSYYWDLNYFKYCFLKIGGHAFNETSLEDDFDSMVAELSDHTGMQVLVHRDFQSRNLMVCGDRLFVIDFQGARRGHPLYDVISLLWQARASLPIDMRSELFTYYLSRIADMPGFSAQKLQEQYPVFVLFRVLQVMGAYGLRGLHEQRPHFIASIPHAVQNLKHLFGTFPALKRKFPELYILAGALDERYTSIQPHGMRNQPGHEPTKEAQKMLYIKIQSFSYRNGYPRDHSEHGGGHVFDCRLLPNPGRDERYKALSGLDDEVISWLEEKEEVHRFFDHFSSVVLQSVNAYLERGFNYLAVNFGCTGGQHRSVYMTERLAALLRKMPHIEVSVIHLNRNAWKR